ncbi:MAG: PSD1 domain-containing protein [Phycisphaerales bacterium]|nr:PSD1 domain-containing protein [Phycisphaerales bacterium]
MRRFGIGIGAGVLLTGVAVGARGPRPEAAAAGSSGDLARDVRPILSNTCFKCHGPDPSARKAELRLDTAAGLVSAAESGKAPIAPGDRGASELWRRITTDDPEDRMPPPDSGRFLTPEQIATIGAWIDSGAKWKNHWSFEPVLRHPLPEVSDPAWCRNEIDRFVLARLDSEGLEHSPEADRATLIRRVSLDLIGLPPTPEEVDAFLADTAPGAYERVVDRLLASEHYGERWARVWLDLARYADTKGYEKDAGRTMWPYRDWVIRALNADMPFDRFTIDQLAGDLVPNPTDDELLATAFHRNTMTNDEGGTDNEEFRVAAVKDRVSTTMSVWTGLTMNCAECHTHKYDPLTQTEYYKMFAFFDQSQDADREDDAPTHAFGSLEQTARLAAIDAETAGLGRQIDEVVATAVVALDDTQSTPAAETGGGTAGPRADFYWIDDDTPAGAPRIDEGGLGWRWVWNDEHPAATGTRSLVGSSAGFSQRFVQDAPIPLAVHEGDAIVASVWLESADVSREIMLQIHTVRAGWAHRAYWGENLLNFGAEGTPERLALGPLPAPGQWVRLEVAPESIGLMVGDEIDGLALSQFGGTVRWDGVGLSTRQPPDERWRVDMADWERLLRGRGGAGLPEAVRAALLAEHPSDEQSAALRRHYVRYFHAPARERLRPLEESLAALGSERGAVVRAMVSVPVMAELSTDMRRTTHRLEKGSFLSPAEEVTPGVPEALNAFPAGAPLNRLGLAEWIVARDNPLTARVFVNRHWEQFFGRGLVETLEDFGAQGTPPTHPELLDWLALRFMENGWSMKQLCRTIVTSATYRQDSDASPGQLDADLFNTLLGRGPRFRVEAELVRDQALAVSGLLSPKMYGPPVYPPQPEGIWQVVYSGESWMPSKGEDAHRRGLYTYWRRTSPYPSMTTFDAPSREVCTPRRVRTNTPLQAFVTLNDPVYVEAAQALARRMMAEGGPIASERARRGLRLCLAREPRREEVDVILELVADQYEHFKDRAPDATRLATEPLGPLPDGVDPAEAAAWTVAANVMLNMDEFLTRK